MYGIICEREDKDGDKIFIPIMFFDEDAAASEEMATYDTFKEAEGVAKTHILCKASRNIIINLETGKGVII